MGLFVLIYKSSNWQTGLDKRFYTKVLYIPEVVGGHVLHAPPCGADPGREVVRKVFWRILSLSLRYLNSLNPPPPKKKIAMIFFM